mmetsp:Transcript_12913/g.47843  ORF Transcript_12913/g.47843 Transcript_12913/m.47843 type:complete len:258 (+) Transcript_12913:802-1575(+)
MAKPEEEVVQEQAGKDLAAHGGELRRRQVQPRPARREGVGVRRDEKQGGQVHHELERPAGVPLVGRWQVLEGQVGHVHVLALRGGLVLHAVAPQAAEAVSKHSRGGEVVDQQPAVQPREERRHGQVGLEHVVPEPGLGQQKLPQMGHLRVHRVGVEQGQPSHPQHGQAPRHPLPQDGALCHRTAAALHRLRVAGNGGQGRPWPARGWTESIPGGGEASRRPWREPPCRQRQRSGAREGPEGQGCKEQHSTRRHSRHR